MFALALSEICIVDGLGLRWPQESFPGASLLLVAKVNIYNLALWLWHHLLCHNHLLNSLVFWLSYLLLLLFVVSYGLVFKGSSGGNLKLEAEVKKFEMRWNFGNCTDNNFILCYKNHFFLKYEVFHSVRVILIRSNFPDEIIVLIVELEAANERIFKADDFNFSYFVLSTLWQKVRVICSFILVFDRLCWVICVYIHRLFSIGQNEVGM